MSDGTEKVMKHTNKKLRLTEDKFKLVADVLKDDFSELDLTVGQHFVCVTCFRRIEKVKSMVTESAKLKVELSESFKRVRGLCTLDLPSTRKPVIEKRMAKSPCMSKEIKVFKVTRVRPIQPKPFADLTNTSSLFTPSDTSTQIQTSLPTTVVRSTPERRERPEKTARRKLISEGDEEGNAEVRAWDNFIIFVHACFMFY